MAWPSGSKAGTTHVDNGNDLLRNARADIKQNIDNVNSIIDEFNISSPSNGDLLQYSSSSGKWEQVASSSVGGGTAYLILTGNQGEQVSGNLFRRPLAVLHNPGFITQPGDSGFGAYNNEPTGENFNGQATLTFSAGTYFMYITDVYVDNDTEAQFTLFDETNTTTLDSSFIARDEVGTTGDSILTSIPKKVVFTGSTEISVRQNGTARTASTTLIIHKVA